MSTPKLREDEIAMPGFPRAWCVTTSRRMANQRYHYPAGAWVIWGPVADGRREPVRIAVHTMCRNWLTLPVLVDGAVDGEICDLCKLHESRVRSVRPTSGQVDF